MGNADSRRDSSDLQQDASGTGSLRWGIMGVGGISNDFCIGLVNNKSRIAAVAARELSRAEAFAKTFKADNAHGSYEALASDPNVDIVYVGTIHTYHLPHAKMAMEAGKHVVCEKPMAINEGQVQELVDLARKKGVFFMEAMWTRFFPAIRKVREILASGSIGTPKSVQGDFGFEGPTDEKHRLLDPVQGGGAMLDIGIYLVQVATMAFGATYPEQMSSTGLKGSTGVDLEGSISMSWEGKGSASLMYTIRANTPETMLIICSGGYIRIDGPAHCPTTFSVFKGEGRGQFTEEKFKFDLPRCPSGYKVNYPRSEGMLYQVQAVEACIKAGKTESDEYPLEESVVIAKIMDEHRRQLGIAYPCETSGCTVC